MSAAGIAILLLFAAIAVLFISLMVHLVGSTRRHSRRVDESVRDERYVSQQLYPKGRRWP